MEFSTGRGVRFIAGIILIILAFVLNPMVASFGMNNSLLSFALFAIPFFGGLILMGSAFIGGGN